MNIYQNLKIKTVNMNINEIKEIYKEDLVEYKEI